MLKINTDNINSKQRIKQASVLLPKLQQLPKSKKPDTIFLFNYFFIL